MSNPSEVNRACRKLWRRPQDGLCPTPGSHLVNLWKTEAEREQPVLLADGPRARKAEALAQPQHGLETLDGAPRRVEGLEAAHPRHTSSHFGFLGCGGVAWLGWGRLRRCSAGRARWRPSEGQGFQELGPGGEHNIGAQGLQVVEEAGSGSKRLAGVPPSA